MLEQLFGSHTRTKLLKLFLTNPGEAYFIRELTRKIDTQINSVRRELKNLLDTGIIRELGQDEVDSAVAYGKRNDLPTTPEEDEEGMTASDRQLKKYFQADPRFPLFKELQSLFVKSPLLLQHRFITELDALGNVSYLSMMGRFVGDTANRIDLFMVGAINRPRLDIIIADFEKELEHELNYTIMNMDEYNYRQGVTDKFLFNLMESKKIEVVNTLVNTL